MIYGVVSEMLTLTLPLMFPRSWLISTPERYVGLSSPALSEMGDSYTKIPITGLHYIVAGAALTSIPQLTFQAMKSLVRLSLYPIQSIRSALAYYLRLFANIHLGQRRLASALQLALRGSSAELRDMFNVSVADATLYLIECSPIILFLLLLKPLLHGLVAEGRRLAQRWGMFS